MNEDEIKNVARDAVGKSQRAAQTVHCDVGSRAGEYVGRTVQEQPLLSLIGVAAVEAKNTIFGERPHGQASGSGNTGPRVQLRLVAERSCCGNLPPLAALQHGASGIA
jgi:hypothetical protein